MSVGSKSHQCQDCGKIYSDDNLPKTLWQMHKLAERISPGEICPSGECECGAVTHLVKPDGVLLEPEVVDAQGDSYTTEAVRAAAEKLANPELTLLVTGGHLSKESIEQVEAYLKEPNRHKIIELEPIEVIPVADPDTPGGVPPAESGKVKLDGIGSLVAPPYTDPEPRTFYPGDRKPRLRWRENLLYDLFQELKRRRKLADEIRRKRGAASWSVEHIVAKLVDADHEVLLDSYFIDVLEIVVQDLHWNEEGDWSEAVHVVFE